jgi:probable HAF family extracellular repeat protein
MFNKSKSLSAVIFLFAAQIIFAASFQGLGYLPGDSPVSCAYGISADGTVVVGASCGQAFRWTASEGMKTLSGSIPPTEYSSGNYAVLATSVSANGSVVVGYCDTYSGRQAFRWTDTQGIDCLGSLPGSSNSMAYGVSADGSVVVGNGNAASGEGEAFRWTAAEGMVSIGDLPGGWFYSEAYDISSDGSVIVGVSNRSRSSVNEAFRWSHSSMEGLGFLHNGSDTSIASGVSADGSIIVGVSEGEAFRWTADEGMVGLGFLYNRDFSFPLDVSGNGSVAVGYCQSEDMPWLAFYWTAAGGMQNLGDMLASHGLDLTGWRLSSATGVSADGMTIVGYGKNPQGYFEAWIATIPEPTTILLLIFGVGLIQGRRYV